MATNLKAGEKTNKENNEADMMFPVQVESHQEICETESLSDSVHTSLLKAQENAMFAKEAAIEAINRVYKESEESAETLAKVINEVIQSNIGKTNESCDTRILVPDTEAKQENQETETAKQHDKSEKSGLVQKILNNRHCPFNILFVNKATEIESEIREEFHHPVKRQNIQLRPETEEKAQRKTGETIEEAEISIIEAQKALDEAEMIKRAAREAVKQVREEIKKAKEEAEMTRRTAEIAISQAKQEAMSQAAEEIIKAQIEVRAAKEAAESAIRQAQDETIRSKEEVEAANNHAQVAIALAQDKIKAISEEIEAVRRQSRIAISQAQDEATKAKKEAESAKKMAQEAVAKAEEESQKVKEEAEASILKANKAMTQAKQHVINMTRSEIIKTRQEIETASRDPDSLLKKPLEPGLEALNYPGESDETDTHHVTKILHEMRTPLHSLSGFARLMLEDNISDITTQKEFLAIIVKQSESLHRLLDDLSSILEQNNESYII